MQDICGKRIITNTDDANAKDCEDMIFVRDKICRLLLIDGGNMAVLTDKQMDKHIKERNFAKVYLIYGEEQMYVKNIPISLLRL